MKNLLMFAAILSVPLLFGLNVAQAYRYTAMRQEMERLEAEQRVWIENNKRLITAVSALEAPSRVVDISREKLGLKKAGARDILRVELKHGTGETD